MDLSITRGWSLRQLDAKNMFLHGVLEEEVYMTQLSCPETPQALYHVCKLGKAIYGLNKQLKPGILG
jgi:hypothetical protein